jgi:hypothetical protein
MFNVYGSFSKLFLSFSLSLSSLIDEFDFVRAPNYLNNIFPNDVYFLLEWRALFFYHFIIKYDYISET